MKNFILLAFLTNFVCFSFAQEHVFSVSYQALMRYVQESVTPYETEKTLLIDSCQSLFYEKRKSEIEPEMLKKNFPQKGLLTFKDKISYLSCYYTEPIPNFDWEMLDGDSIVCDYPCKKAKTTFRGRTWTVWYAEELPYSDGPWKLCGLPGLILKAVDSLGDFSFTAFKIQNQEKGKKLSFSLKGYKRTTPQQYANDLIYSRKDAWGFDEAVTGRKHGMVSFDGVPYTPPSETACLMEYFDEK